MPHERPAGDLIRKLKSKAFTSGVAIIPRELFGKFKGWIPHIKAAMSVLSGYQELNDVLEKLRKL
jgi:hypothetical protein